MAEFFSGVRTYPAVALDPYGRLTCEISEEWVHLDEDLISCCGALIEREVSVTMGLSRRDYRSIEDTLSGSLGVKDVAQVTGTLKQTTGVEISWKLEEMRRQKVQAKSPECGSQVCEVWQLRRDYLWTRSRRILKILGPIQRRHSEATRNTTVRYRTQEIDPLCNCKPAEAARPPGLIDAFLGRLQLILSAYQEPGSRLVAAIGTLRVEAGYPDNRLRVPANALPDWVVSLADIDPAGEAELVVRQHRQAHYDPPTATPDERKSGTESYAVAGAAPA